MLRREFNGTWEATEYFCDLYGLEMDAALDLAIAILDKDAEKGVFFYYEVDV